MKLRFPLVLVFALAAFAVPAGSAFASVGVFDAPADNATVSQNQLFSVATAGVVGAAGVNFYTSTDGGITFSQFVGGCMPGSSGDMLYNPVTNAADIPCADSAGNYTVNLGIGGWTDGPTPIEAVIVDSVGNPLETLTKNVTIDNLVAPLVISATSPADASTVSGTITLSVTPTDLNNRIAVAEFSTDGGATWTSLAAGGNGAFTASIDTAAIPNGDSALHVQVRVEDAAGNQNADADYWYTVQNPQAPVIQPNTLIADKAQFRTAETQLETGDIVEAYGMQASGYPDPTSTYVWHLCPAGGGTCTNVPADSTGDYTVQPGDVGATLTLIATATNASGSASTTVDFGVIAQGYVAPTVTPGTFAAVDSNGHSTVQIGDTLQVTHAPAYTGGYPAPTTTYTWVICQGQNCQTADGQTYTVQTADAGASITVYADVVNTKGADNAMFDFGAVATPSVPSTPSPAVTTPVVTTPAPPVAAPPVASPPVVTVPVVTPGQQKTIEIAQAAVQTKTAAVAAAQTAANAANATVKTVQRQVDAAMNTVASGTATPAQKQQLVSKVTALVAAKHVAAEKLAAVKTVATKAAAALNVATRTLKTAQVEVAAAQTAVSTGTATQTEKKQLAKTKQNLVGAQAVASVKTNDVAIAAKQLVITHTAVAHSIGIAQSKVSTALSVVASSNATPTAKKALVAIETKLVTVQAVASVKTDSLRKSTAQLALALKKASALKP